MSKIKALVLAGAVTALTVVPSGSALASHRCALEDVNHEVNVICENYHNPKPLLGYIVCLLSPTC